MMKTGKKIITSPKASSSFKEKINNKILTRYPEIDLSQGKVVVSAKLI